VRESQDPPVVELDAQRPIATRDMTHRAGRQASAVSIRLPPASCGRLHDEQRVASCEEGHDRLTPASVMWKFDHIGARHRTAGGTLGQEAHRGDGFDVARQEERTHSWCCDLFDGPTRVADGRGSDRSMRGVDPQHDRCIVVTGRPESARWPEHIADCIAEVDSVPHRDRLDARSLVARGLEQFGDGCRSRGRIEQRVMHDEPLDTRETDQIDRSAVVVEIGMAHDECVDAPSTAERPGKRPAARDSTRRTRSDIEHHAPFPDLEEVRRSISDRKRHERHSRRSGFSTCQIDSGMDARRGRDEGDHSKGPHGSAVVGQGHDRRSTEREAQRDSQRRSGARPSCDRPRSSGDRQRGVHEADLQLDEKPQDRTDWFGTRREDRADHCLRVRDDERRRRDRAADEAQHERERLDAPEMRECDRRTRHERGDAGGNGTTDDLARQTEPCMARARRVIAWNPAEPHAPNPRGEVSQADHAREAQLKSSIGGDRWLVDDHACRCEGEDRIAVPVSQQQHADRADDRHQRRTGRARCRSHQDEREDRRDRDARCRPSVAPEHDARHEGDHPSEDGEVETRDGENVREPDGAKTVLDRRVSRLGVSEHKRDEHRADSIAGSARLLGFVGIDPREKSGSQGTSNSVAKSKHEVRDRSLRNVSLDESAELRRFDGQESNDTASRRKRSRISVARVADIARCRENAENTHSVRDRPRRRCAGDEDGDPRSNPGTVVVRSVDRRAHAIATDEHHVPEHRTPTGFLVEVSCEDVGGESPRREAFVDRSLDRDDRRIGRRTFSDPDGWKHEFHPIAFECRLLQSHCHTDRP